MHIALYMVADNPPRHFQVTLGGLEIAPAQTIISPTDMQQPHIFNYEVEAEAGKLSIEVGDGNGDVWLNGLVIDHQAKLHHKVKLGSGVWSIDL